MQNTTKDKNDKDVTVGSRVLILEIDPRIPEHLLPQEQQDIWSMLNSELTVVEVYKGCAYVEQIWDRGNGMIESHKIPLYPHQMQIVTSTNDSN